MKNSRLSDLHNFTIQQALYTASHETVLANTFIQVSWAFTTKCHKSVYCELAISLNRSIVIHWSIIEEAGQFGSFIRGSPPAGLHFGPKRNYI